MQAGINPHDLIEQDPDEVLLLSALARTAPQEALQVGQAFVEAWQVPIALRHLSQGVQTHGGQHPGTHRRERFLGHAWLAGRQRFLGRGQFCGGLGQEGARLLDLLLL